MLLKEFELSRINYWFAYTASIDDNVYDIVVLNYTEMNLDLTFKFKRYKALCFYELFLDYGETYTQDWEYTELNQQLNKVIPYLEFRKKTEGLSI